MNWTPLNGTKTHPLSKHAVEAIHRIRHEGTVLCTAFNPGVVNRLLREENIELCWESFGSVKKQCLRLKQPEARDL